VTDENKNPAPQAEPEPSDLDRELAQLEAEAETIEDAPPVGEITAAETQAASAAQRAAEVEDEYRQLLLAILGPLPAVLCPNWNIQPAEIKTLVDAYAKACAHQWPDGVGEMGPWAGAAITTMVVAGPRLAMGVPPRLKKKPDPAPEPGEVDHREPGENHRAQQGAADGSA
jgi:hypothetical protein